MEYLRNCAFSSEFVIQQNELSHLIDLMNNYSSLGICQDPNSHDMIPHHQSLTVSQQIPMRWRIPLNNK